MALKQHAVAQWLCAVAAVTCLAPTASAEPDPQSRALSAGLGIGFPEGFQAIVSLRPNRYSSLEMRAYTWVLFSGADIGLTAHVPVGGGEILLGGAVGKAREDGTGFDEDKAFTVAKYSLGIGITWPESEFRFDVGRMYMDHDGSWESSVVVSWLWTLDRVWAGSGGAWSI